MATRPARHPVLTAASAAPALGRAAPALATAAAFAVLYAHPIAALVRDWTTDPDASHGLLLAPVAVLLACRRGRAPRSRPQPALGLLLLAAAVFLRDLAALAAELFTLRLSLVAALAALVVFAAGLRQLLHWWLPATLLVLSIPLPDVLASSLAFPLQLRSSRLGAALLEWRHVPVRLAGNRIELPGHTLFVTEACSGLRSLSALLSLGFLVGGLWLRRPWSRALLVLAAVPVAMALNGVRVFLTGFLVFFVDPALGEGIMHLTEGWVLFAVALAVLATLAWTLTRLESRPPAIRRAPA